MAGKPTYDELEQKVNELQQAVVKFWGKREGVPHMKFEPGGW